MLKKNIKNILGWIEKITGWKMVIVPKNTEFRPTAVKSDIGFWYAGKVIDEADISYGIFRNGLVEAFETNLVLKILTYFTAHIPHCNFYDIGANSGYYGVMAAYTGKDKTSTYSFEPLTEYGRLIEESVFLNRLENNVRLFKHALGSSQSTATMQLAGSGSSLTPGFLGTDNHLPTREIQIRTLDTVVDESDLPAPHFIKIDVEGFELEVVKGALATITNTKPVLFIEIAKTLNTNHGEYRNEHVSDIFDLLHGLGYNAFIVKNSVIPVTDCVSETGAFMYLFLHKQNSEHSAIRAII